MIRLAKIYAFVVLLVLIGSTLSHFQQSGSQSARKQSESNWLNLPDSFEWQSILVKHEAFKSEEVATEQKVEPESIDILSSSLVAIVAGTPSSVTLLIKGAPLPVTLNVGQSWLEGWTLTSISADHVVWTETGSDRTKTQYLYGSPESSETQNKLTAKIDGKR